MAEITLTKRDSDLAKISEHFSPLLAKVMALWYSALLRLIPPRGTPLRGITFHFS